MIVRAGRRGTGRTPPATGSLVPSPPVGGRAGSGAGQEGRTSPRDATLRPCGPFMPLPSVGGEYRVTTRCRVWPREAVVQVREIMTGQVAAIGPDTSVKFAADVMAARGFAALPVV